MLALLAGLVLGVDANAADADSHHSHEVKAATQHHDDRDFNAPPLAFEPMKFVFTLVLFVAFLFFMRPAVWEPLIQSLGAREGRIAQAELDAKAVRLEVEKLAAQSEARLAEVQREVAALLAKARVDAEAQKAEIIAKADADAQRIRQAAVNEIAQAKSEALSELEQASGNQVALATEHLAGIRF